MFDVLFATLLAILIIDSVHAQVSAPNCSENYHTSTWAYNTLGQSPCVIVAYLAAACTNGGQYIVFSISPLNSGAAYGGPSALYGPYNDTTCLCNTVAYSLFSCCDACQNVQWTNYSTWSRNCTSVATAGTFPDAVPALTRVPRWAYHDPTVDGSDSWDNLVAEYIGGLPEVTGSASNVPSSTSSITPGTSSRASSSSKSSSNAGAIAGSVIGGVAGVAVITGLVAWFTTRRRRRHAPSADYISGQGSDMGVAPHAMDVRRPKLYNPSDSSTHPMRPTSAMIHPPASSNQNLDSSSDLQPNGNAYDLPEI